MVQQNCLVLGPMMGLRDVGEVVDRKQERKYIVAGLV